MSDQQCLHTWVDQTGEVVGVGCLLHPGGQVARLIRRLRRRAFTDPLTGALNRAGLEERMAHLPQVGRSAVLFIDLDGFRQVNDQAGHHLGDQLLRRCGRRIRACLPEEHTLARRGGDEFVAVVEQLPENPLAARRMTEAICRAVMDALRSAYRIDQRLFTCPASIGACCYQPRSTDHQSAMRIAGRAMYRVKNGGKNAFRVVAEDVT